MTPQTEKMAVNAAIERIIAREDDDREAARTVVRYGSKLRGSGKLSISSVSKTETLGGEITGHSPEHGDVTIKESDRKEIKERSFGVYKDRVGYYRLWKDKDGLLQFQHFWKSIPETRAEDDEEPESYSLGYDPASLEPTFLGVHRRDIVMSAWVWFGTELILHRYYLEDIYGEAPRYWGFNFEIHMQYTKRK